MRDADQEKPKHERQPKAAVDDQLHEEVAADSPASVVHSLGRGRHSSLAHQSQEAIAHVLAFEQHEDNQHQRQGQAADGL